MKRLSKKINDAAKQIESGRQITSDFKFDKNNLIPLVESSKLLHTALDNLLKGSEKFLMIHSATISPDGKLGGRGFTMGVHDIRSNLLSASNVISQIIDSFEDEIRAKHWGALKDEDETEAGMIQEDEEPLVEEINLDDINLDFGESDYISEDEFVKQDIQPKSEQPEEVDEDKGNTPDEEVIDQGQIKDKAEEDKIKEEPETEEPQKEELKKEKAPEKKEPQKEEPSKPKEKPKVPVLAPEE